ncbi:MAG: hypothetical protein M3146_07210, partial [Thermoproteota archaeon]|nr:hypothetical protein [Thermoproteota archaeon]
MRNKFSHGTTKKRIGERSTGKRSLKVDRKDVRIVGLLVAGYDNKQISAELQIPLSTVQRRT